MDLLQSVVEIVTYGYRQDPQIFEYESVVEISFFLLQLVLFFGRGFYNCD